MEGWVSATLGDILETLRNGLNARQSKDGIGDKISRIESIADETFDAQRVGFATLNSKHKEKFRLQRGDVLFSHLNSAPHIGKTAVFDLDEEVYHGVNLLLMRPTASLDSRFLHRYLQYLYSSGFWRSICKQSVNQASVNQRDIKRVPISYPRAIPEQRRIVAILDEVFEGIDRAIANTEQNLANARELFESYLNRVFIAHCDSYPLKPLAAVCTFENGDRGKNYPGRSAYVPTGIPVINAGHLTSDGIDFDTLNFITPERYALLERGRVRPGDVLFCLRGSLGKCAMVREMKEGVIASSLVILRPKAELHAEFLLDYLNTQLCAEEIERHSNGAAQPNLSAKAVGRFRIPVPPTDMQAEAIDRVREIRERTKNLDSHYTRKLAALAELKQSILRKAFSGELTGAGDQTSEVLKTSEV